MVSGAVLRTESEDDKGRVQGKSLLVRGSETVPGWGDLVSLEKMKLVASNKPVDFCRL